MFKFSLFCSVQLQVIWLCNICLPLCFFCYFPLIILAANFQLLYVLRCHSAHFGRHYVSFKFYWSFYPRVVKFLYNSLVCPSVFHYYEASPMSSYRHMCWVQIVVFFTLILNVTSWDFLDYAVDFAVYRDCNLLSCNFIIYPSFVIVDYLITCYLRQ